MSVADWPVSPLDAAERAFDLLVVPPTHVAFDGRGFDGLPDRIVPLDELRLLLLVPATGVEVRDAVWRELVVRARRDGPAWVVAAVGIAMPGLRRVAGMLTAGWRGDTADLDAELLVGFMARLTTIDLDAPRVCGRLLDAGLRGARRARDADARVGRVRAGVSGPIAPVQPWDHPELVLARAVAIGVIDADEFRLIAETRLGDCTLAAAASSMGVPTGTACEWRTKAEARLAEAIGDGDLAFVPLSRRRRRRGTAAAQATRSAQPARTDHAARADEVARTAPAGPAVSGPAVGSVLGAGDATRTVIGTQQGALGVTAAVPHAARSVTSVPVGAAG